MPHSAPPGYTPPGTHTPRTVKYAHSTYTSMQTPKVSHLIAKRNRVKFLLSDADVALANALRRVAMNEVPTLAFEFVTIDVNDSPIPEEVLSARIGLVPIAFHPADNSPVCDHFCLHRECPSAGHCRRCAVFFHLDVHNTGDVPKNVTSADLVLADRSRADEISIAHFSCVEEAAALSRCSPGITITCLPAGGRLRATCIATMGVGAMHAKWSPTTICKYRFESDVRLNADMVDLLTVEQRRAFAEACPRGVATVNPATGVLALTPKAGRRVYDATALIALGTKHSKGPMSLISARLIPGRFWFTVEVRSNLCAVLGNRFLTVSLFVNQTRGSLAPAEVVDVAFGIVEEKLECVQEATHRCDDVVAILRPGDAAAATIASVESSSAVAPTPPTRYL